MERISFSNTKEYVIEKVIYENPNAKTKVMRVRDDRLGRTVILKQIGFDNKMQKDLILREVKNQVVLEAQSDFVPKIHNIILDERTRTITIEMQLVAGTSLRSLIEQKSVLEKKENWYRENYELLVSICRSIDRIHRVKGFVHKDLKPENIIVNRSRNAVYVIDFGISGPGMNRGVGTPKYMAPEQQVKVDKYNVMQATDVFALGQIAVEMFRGTPLVYGKELVLNPMGDQWLKKVDISNIGSSYYPKLGMVLEKALSMNPSDRFPNAGKMLEALQIRKDGHNGRK